MIVANGSIPVLEAGIRNLSTAFSDEGEIIGARRLPVEINSAFRAQRKEIVGLKKALAKDQEELQKRHCKTDESGKVETIKEKRGDDKEEREYLIFKSERDKEMYTLEWDLLLAKTTDMKVYRFSLNALKPIGNIEEFAYAGIEWMLHGYDESVWEEGQEAAFSHAEELRTRLADLYSEDEVSDGRPDHIEAEEEPLEA